MLLEQRIDALQREVLEYLREDPYFRRGNGLIWKEPGTTIKRDKDRTIVEYPDEASLEDASLAQQVCKVQVVGRCGPKLHGRCNGKDISNPMPASRLQQWIAAFRDCNKSELAKLDGLIREALEPFTDAELKVNGKELKKLKAHEWFGNVAFLQFSKLFPHYEHAHFDGGAACSLMAITLWGSRDLAMFPKPSADDEVPPAQAEDNPEWELHFGPGAVYHTCIVPVKHQVRYYPDVVANVGLAKKAFDSPDLGECSCQVVFRTPLWSAWGQVNAKDRLPVPQPIWHAFHSAFLRWQGDAHLDLPSYTDVCRQPCEPENQLDHSYMR